MGFTIEVFSFVTAGFLAGIKQILYANIILIFAFMFAIWTGNQIKKEGENSWIKKQ